MFDAWHEFCDVSIVRDQLKKNLKFWDDMDNKGLTTIEVSLKYFLIITNLIGSGHYSFYKSKIFNEQKFFMKSFNGNLDVSYTKNDLRRFSTF